MHNAARTAALLLALPGLVVPFLPFVHDESPFSALRMGWPAWLLGAPFFLAAPIALWHACRLGALRPSRFEIVAAYALSACAMVLVLAFTAMEVERLGGGIFRGIAMPVSIGSCWTVVAVNMLLLRHLLAKRLSREIAAEAFLISGYLPNAVFCLAVFSLDSWSRLQAGAWLALLSCTGYVVAIAIALGKSTRPGLPPGSAIFTT